MQQIEWTDVKNCRRKPHNYSAQKSWHRMSMAIGASVYEETMQFISANFSEVFNSDSFVSLAPHGSLVIEVDWGWWVVLRVVEEGSVLVRVMIA